MFPGRFANLDAARARFGDRVDRIGGYLSRVDEIGDRAVASIDAMPPGQGWKMLDRASRHGIASVAEAPDSFRELFAQVERVPPWVDWETLDRGGALLLRAGPLGGLVLALKSLVLGYTSPGGNKPLAFSGRLAEQAPRRLYETGRFVQATIRPGGLRPHAEGTCITLKVRLMHAHVRRMILASGRWNAAEWGEPVNQHDLVGTSMLFSLVLLDGLRQLGVRITRDDSEAYMHLWRYSGYLMGVDPELLPASEADAHRLAGPIAATQGEPDEDSRLLTRALLEAPLREAKTPRARKNAERTTQFARAMCRELLGTELADKLGIPSSSWRLMVPLVRRLVSGVELIRESVPFAGTPALWAGTRYWDQVVELGLAGAAAEFGLPQRLARAA